MKHFGPYPELLIFTQWFAPGYRAGGPIRSTTNLAALLRDHYDVRVVTSDRDLGNESPYQGLVRDTWTSLNDSLQVMYLSPQRQSSACIRDLLSESRADCIYLNSMFSPRFTLLPLLHRRRGKSRRRVVVAPRGELLDGAFRYKWAKKTAYLAVLRAAGVLGGVEFHATDEAEKLSIIRRLAVDHSRVHVLPNVPEPPVSAWAPINKRTGEIALLFLSRIAAKKNLLFLLDCLKGVPTDLSVRLTIAGPTEDAAYWARCRGAIAALPANVAVTAVGAIPHDRVRAVMAEHHCFVLPTLGENYGHSIVEALGTGRPVIVSDRTPWRGLTAEGVGWDFPLGDSTALTAAVCEAARLDQTAFDRLADASLAYARRLSATDGLRTQYVDLFTPR